MNRYVTLYRNVTGVASAVGGLSMAGFGELEFYHSSKQDHFISCVGQTFVGTIGGGLVGCGVGFMWPLTAAVAVARRFT